jgi:hypothetical protein
MRLIFALLWTWMFGACCLVVGWWLRPRIGPRQPPPRVYVWPLAGIPLQRQLHDCEAVATRLLAEMRGEEARTHQCQAQWVSGLGPEFPVVGRN